MTSSPGPVRWTTSGGILRVTIDRPERRNALGGEVIESLGQIFAEQQANDALSLAVLTGAGDKAFAAGGDLKELASLREESDVRAFSIGTREAFDALREFPVPVIAAINGDALGGGAELAMACDMRIMAPHARIGFLQGALAITTAWGGAYDLFSLLGPARGLELLMSSRRLAAGEALAAGLVNAVAPAELPFADAVEQFLSTFSHQRPQVARGFKALAQAARQGPDRPEAVACETRHFVATWLHEDHWSAADRAMQRLGAGTRRDG